MQQGKENEIRWVQWVCEPLMKMILVERTSLVLRMVRFGTVRRLRALLAVFWGPWPLVTMKSATCFQTC